MKNLIILMFVAFAKPCFAQGAACDSVVWDAGRKLAWDDFKGQPDAGTNANTRLHYNFFTQLGRSRYYVKNQNGLLC